MNNLSNTEVLTNIVIQCLKMSQYSTSSRFRYDQEVDKVEE